MMDRQSAPQLNRKWHICLFLLGLHIHSETALGSRHSYPQTCVCVRLVVQEYAKCVLPSICILKLANQPVVFQGRTSTQSLSVKWFPREASSQLPMLQIFILIKFAKWRSRGGEWTELKRTPSSGERRWTRLSFIREPLKGEERFL